MTNTDVPSKVFRANPNANPAGSAFLMTLLQRYTDQVQDRTRQELRLAKEIDAQGARDRVEEAVSAWRALPRETQIAVGGPAATADHRVSMTEDTLVARAREAFRQRGVHNPGGFTARPSTVGQTPSGARVFTMPDTQSPLRPGDTKGGTDAPTGKGEVSADPGSAEKVLGNPVPVVDLDPGRQPAPRSAGAAARPAETSTAAAPIYTVTWVGLYCKEESSWDQGSNSDEPYVSFNVFDDSNHSWSKRSKVYSDVDRKEVRGPVPNPTVLFGPAHLPTERTYVSALVTEHDFGDPEKIKKLWHDAATVAACAAKYYGVEVDQAVIDSAANLLHALFNLGDDIIGWDTNVLWPEGFEWYLSFPLNEFKGIWYDFFLYHTDNDSEYYTFYRIDRY